MKENMNFFIQIKNNTIGPVEPVRLVQLWPDEYFAYSFIQIELGENHFEKFLFRVIQSEKLFGHS